LFIKNLKVEEGFFDNLNLDFTQGLNVLVGGRGVGKTSVIELLRFGLGVGSLSPNNNSESSSHAVSILQSSGRVTIEAECNGVPVTISRSALDNEPFATSSYEKPIIFSQTEIETISLNSSGKLSLIDSFDPKITEKYQELAGLNTQLRSSSAHLTQNKKELTELLEGTSQYQSLKTRENQLVVQQQELQKQNVNIQSNQQALNNIQTELASISVDLQNISALKQIFEQRIANLESLNQPVYFQQCSSPQALQLNNTINQALNSDSSALQLIISNNKNTLQTINQNIQILTNKKLSLDDQARANRVNVDKFNQGAGALLGELGRLRQSLAQIENTQKIAQDKKDKIRSLYDIIQSNLEETAKIKEVIQTKRIGIINELNNNLLPTINSSLSAQSNLNDYALALENCMRGSGLKYKELIPNIVQKVSPAWLLYYTNTLKYQGFANSVGIPVDRATRLIGYLSEVDIGQILVSKIEDVVDFALLDHSNYKPVEQLSIGQRCTVALSVILENSQRVLIVDQPEDHLDNEFIAQTLIKSITQRTKNAQTILSSHNANIPVLGNADNVINLDSNGQRGFIKCHGRIDSPDVKNVIESIMEGGKEAFQSRSTFYAS
jgi:energy-coupling factor transporter ATP-binding protein EcfA2